MHHATRCAFVWSPWSVLLLFYVLAVTQRILLWLILKTMRGKYNNVDIQCISGVATVGPSGALAPPSASVAPPSGSQLIM